MKRTKDRPTVTGAVNPKFALWLGLALFVIGVGILFLVSNMAAIMGLLGFFFYVVPYTMLTKRTTIYNTEVGSISGAMPPIIGLASIFADFFVR